MMDLNAIQFREMELIESHAIEVSALVSICAQLQIDKAELMLVNNLDEYRRQVKERLVAEIWHLVYGDLRAPLMELRHDMCSALGSIDSHQFHDSLTKKLNAILKMIECPTLEPDRCSVAAHESEHDQSPYNRGNDSNRE